MPVTIASLIINMQPLFTTVFAFFLLGERIMIIEAVCLLISFYGVYLLISSQGGPNTETESKINLSSFFVLLGSPILMAVTNILLRHMKMLHQYTSAVYTVITGMVTFGFVSLFTGITFEMLSSFEVADYFILLSVSLFGLMAMVSKARAL